MVRSRTLLVLVLAGALLALVGFGGLVVGGVGGALGAGETLHVEIVDQETLGVVAGLAKLERRTWFGLGVATTTPTTGWVVLVPEGMEAPGASTPLVVTDTFPFQDPNGATWLAREAAYAGGLAWLVPVGATLHDDTVGDYNFALVVNWDKVPGDEGLGVHYLEDVNLA